MRMSEERREERGHSELTFVDLWESPKRRKREPDETTVKWIQRNGLGFSA